MVDLILLVAVVMIVLGYRQFSDVGGSVVSSLKAFKKGLRDDDETGGPRDVKEIGGTAPETGAGSVMAGDEKELEEGRMPLWEHLDDLRNCMIRSLLALFVGVCVTFTFSERVVRFLETPLLRVLPPGNQKLYYTGITDKFMVYLKVSIILGAVVMSPYLLYQIWVFVSPALYKKEKRFFIPFAFFGTLSFVVGLAFAYYVVIPYGYQFLIHFGSPDDQAIITLTQYFDLTLKLLAAMGLIFELPIIMMLLAKFGVVTAKTLRRYRRHAILGSAVVAGVITPTPDAFTMIIVWLPIYMLYEVGIIGVVWAEKKPETAEVQTDA